MIASALTRIFGLLAGLWLGLHLVRRSGTTETKAQAKDDDRANADAIRDRVDAVPRPRVLRSADTRGYRD